MKKSISDQVLTKIEQDKIQPKARWEFVARDSLVWFMAILSIIVGSLAVSVVIFLVNSSFQLDLEGSQVKKFISLLPYFWLAILAVFLIFAYFNFKYTKKGYKINPYLLIILSIIISLILGSLSYAVGVGEKLEEIFYQRVPVYQKIMQSRIKPMHNPQTGILIGAMKVTNEQGFILQDFHLNDWQVIVASDMYPVVLKLKTNMRLIIHGKQTDEFVFEAQRIKPLWYSKPMENLMNERNFFQLRTN